MSCEEGKTVLGLTELITVIGENCSENVVARIDTGATKSSIDLSLASKLKLGPVIDSKLIKSAHGSKLRPVIEARIKIKDKVINEKFTLADRAHMRYKVLIGQNVLKKGFLIDPCQGYREVSGKK